MCLRQMVGVAAGATHGFCRCRSWVFIASIAGTVIIVGVHGMVSFASDVGLHVWCLRFSPRFPASGSPLRSGLGAAGAEGVWPLLIVDRSCWMLGMGLRLCSAQGIRGKRCVNFVPLANCSSRFPKQDVHNTTSYL